MELQLKEFLSYYKSQISPHMYDEFLADIEQDCYLDICELADDLSNVGVNLDDV